MNGSNFDAKLFSELSDALGDLESSSAKVASIAQRCRHSLGAISAADGSVAGFPADSKPATAQPPLPSDQSTMPSPPAAQPQVPGPVPPASVSPPPMSPPRTPTPEPEPILDRLFGKFQKHMDRTPSQNSGSGAFTSAPPGAPVPPGAPGAPVPPGAPGAPLPPAPPVASYRPIPPVSPPAPKDPWWTDDKKVVKVIAIIGGLITAAGIAFLVALAIQSGLLGPGARVVLTYLLAAFLGGTAVWAHRRQAPLVAVASLMVTGLATANLTTTAVVRILRWIPAEVGLLAIVAVTCVAFYGARWAKSPATLAWAVVLGNGFMWSVTSSDWEWGTTISQATTSLSALMLMAAAIAAWWNAERSYVVPGFVLAGNASAAYLAFVSAGQHLWLLAVYMIIFTVLQLGPPLLTQQTFASRRSASNSKAHSQGVRLPHENHYTVAVISAAMTPLLMSLGANGHYAMLIAGALSIAYTAFALFNTGETLRYLGHAGAATSVFPWTFMALDGVNEKQMWTVIPVAVGAYAATWMLVYPPKKAYKNFAVIAAGVWLAAAHLAHSHLIESIIVEGIARSSTVTLFEAIGLAFLLLADIGLILAAARNIIQRAIALLGLVLISLPFIHLLMLTGIPFTVAHMLLSITWVTLAGILVLSPRFQHVQSRLAAGLTIATLSVAKLILFDMANLDGFVRALAFIICGLILLAMAVFGAKKRRNNLPTKTES